MIPKRLTIAALLAASAASAHPASFDTSRLNQLFSELARRQSLFASGVLESRQSVWLVDADDQRSALEFARLLTRTPVGGARARRMALHFEEEMLRELGDARQTLWVLHESPLGRKLSEIPLEPGASLGNPKPSSRRGMQVYGFKQGVAAHYDQMAGTLRLREDEADSAFGFRVEHQDPTLDGFALLAAFKQGERRISYSSDSDNSLIVKLRGRQLENYHFDMVGGHYLLATVAISNDGASTLSQSHFGHYGRLGEQRLAAPMCRLDIARQDGERHLVRLRTVVKWEPRQLARREIEIRIPRGTDVVREH